MSESEFLSFLVDQTLELQKNGEAELSSYELKLKDYELSFLKGVFVPQLQVLRFNTILGIIDIPVNWSVFNLHSSSEQGLDHVLDETNNHDFLIEVFNIVFRIELNKLLVTHADGFCYIVGLKSGEEYHLHDLLNPQELLQAA